MSQAARDAHLEKVSLRTRFLTGFSMFIGLIVPHDPALVESPPPALPTGSPSAEAGPDSQNLAHLPLSPLLAHRIHLLLP